jgi:Sugar (and other) transporter
LHVLILESSSLTLFKLEQAILKVQRPGGFQWADGTLGDRKQSSFAKRIFLSLINKLKVILALHPTMSFFPESPRWLVTQDRHEEALQVLAKLHAGGDTADLYVQAELAEITAKINSKRSQKPLCMALFVLAATYAVCGSALDLYVLEL